MSSTSCREERVIDIIVEQVENASKVGLIHALVVLAAVAYGSVVLVALSASHGSPRLSLQSWAAEFSRSACRQSPLIFSSQMSIGRHRVELRVLGRGAASSPWWRRLMVAWVRCFDEIVRV